ncbi:unnamed protein product [Brassica oleracea var. botrytis]
MGALFSQILFERKFRGLLPLDRKPLDESIGSLLTRIFMHHDIDLSDTPCVDTIDRFDAQFFLNTKILHFASKRRRGSSSSGPAQTQCEDDTIPDISVNHTPNPSMEYLLPPFTGQFDSGAPPLDGTQQQQFAWTADTLDKLSTMMQTTSEAAGMTRDDAGNEPSDEATDEERGSRIHRSRRAPGQSRSCSPDDHQ